MFTLRQLHRDFSLTLYCAPVSNKFLPCQWREMLKITTVLTYKVSMAPIWPTLFLLLSRYLSGSVCSSSGGFGAFKNSGWIPSTAVISHWFRKWMLLFEAVHVFVSAQPTFGSHHLRNQLTLTRCWQRIQCWTEQRARLIHLVANVVFRVAAEPTSVSGNDGNSILINLILCCFGWNATTVSYNKTNEMHWFLMFIFGIELYMFRTGFLSIIRTYTYCCIHSNRCMSYRLCCSMLIPLASGHHNLYDVNLLLCIQY
jgi:hypothetical protein